MESTERILIAALELIAKYPLAPENKDLTLSDAVDGMVTIARAALAQVPKDPWEPENKVQS